MRINFSRPINCNVSTANKTLAVGRRMVLSLVLAAVMLLPACADHPRRSAGTVLDDQTLEYVVINNIYSDPSFGQDDHIKVEVHQGVVLLAGETVSEENRVLATQLAEQAKLTRRVVNDLAVGERADFTSKVNNTWLTTKVNSILLKENALPGNDAARIKVVSSQHTVYLMGLVSQEEGEIIAEIVRNIRGVEKVVKIFDYTDHAD